MSRMQRLHIPKNVNPPLDLCIQLMVPSDPEHLSILYGLIEWATIWSNWDRDDAHSGTELAWLYERILLSAKVCETGQPVFGELDTDMLIRQNPDNPCIIETSANGTQWCTLFDLSLCQNFGNQPGPENAEPPPAPGGGTQKTCAQLFANNMLLIPAPVSTGDTILIESASGAGYDGVEFDFGPLWRLPNGNQYVLGRDVGLPTTNSGDPVPTANHMTLIAAIGAIPTYVALPVGTPVTVPAAITNGQLFIQVNDSALADNQGSYQVCVKVTNNAAARWTHDFDFTIDSFAADWSIGTNPTFASPLGTYVPGSGYQSTHNLHTAGSHSENLISIFSNFAIAGTFIIVRFSYSAGAQDCVVESLTFILSSHGGSVLDTVSCPTAPINPYIHGLTGTVTPEITIIPGSSTTSSDPGGLATITHIHLEGTGTDPF